MAVGAGCGHGLRGVVDDGGDDGDDDDDDDEEEEEGILGELKLHRILSTKKEVVLAAKSIIEMAKSYGRLVSPVFISYRRLAQLP